MGVQKSRVSRASRDSRRNHDKLTGPTLSVDRESGETHIRHHITKDGYYKGKQVLSLATATEVDAE